MMIRIESNTIRTNIRSGVQEITNDLATDPIMRMDIPATNVEDSVLLMTAMREHRRPFSDVTRPVLRALYNPLKENEW